MQTTWPEQYGRNALQTCAALAVLILLVFAPFIAGTHSLMDAARDTTSLYPGGAVPGRDLTAVKENDPGGTAWQNEAWLAVEHRALESGSAPWWDPYDGYGKPFIATQQPQPLYPLTLLAALHPSPRVWDLYIATRLMLAAIFAALFVLFFGGRIAAFAAGIATAFSAYFLVYYGMPHLSVEVLIPAMLWATEWSLRRPGTAACGGVALVTAAAFFGGMPESQVILIGTAGAYAVLRTLAQGLGLVRLTTWLAGTLLGGALAAVALLPLLELLGRSYDAHTASAAALGLGRDGLPLLRVLLAQLAPLAFGVPLDQLAYPGNPHPTLTGGVTIVPVFCALLACAAALRARALSPAARSAVLALSVIPLLFLLKNAGFPLVQWIGGLPVLRLVIFEKYDQAAIASCVGLLCGLGICALQQGALARRHIAAAGALTLLGLTIAYAYGVNKMTAGAHTAFFFASVAFALIALLIAASAALSRARRAPLVLALAAAGGTMGAFFLPLYFIIAPLPAMAINPYDGAPFAADLARRTAASGSRVIGLGGVLTANWAGALGLQAPTAIDAIYPNTYLPFVDAFLAPDGHSDNGDFDNRFTGLGTAPIASPLGLRWLTLSSVAYVAIPPDRELFSAQLRPIASAAGVRVYANTDVLPRASIFHRVVGARSNAAALALLTAPHFAPRTTLVLADAADRTGAATTPSEHADLLEHGAERVVIRATLARAGWVMLNDTNYPGWQAELDGRPTPILTADALFRAVAVPPGLHTIVYTYRSAAISHGMWISAAALLIVLALFGIAAAHAFARRVQRTVS